MHARPDAGGETRKIAPHRLDIVNDEPRMVDAESGGPAAGAGLLKGDVVLEFDGATVSGVDDLHRLLIGDRAGTAVPIRILRAGRPLELSITPEPDA